MANIYKAFMALVPKAPLLVGTVSTVSAGGCTVTLPTGAVIAARGDATVGQAVFVRDGVIEGEAPSLTVIDIEI
jgi:hypothetical protein